ncbi:TrkH family potassium uptake protein [Methanosarcina sp. WWM596]|uniref:TrkH family potassium uptake protein n=1 Tax=Methanosarcina sp. WWM596 TaxID=1434103 RepID=UPI0006159D7E|nr:TrkH family potassium uptake protein [Methanosarcina sp. WWM596]AKB18340.1 Potassium uptake protein TrkH [Methanosarcina sp. WWM596]
MYELVSPVNPLAVLRYTGHLLQVFSVVLLVPMLAAFVLGETTAAIIYGGSALITAVTGVILHKVLPDFELEIKEALILAAITFPLCSLVSAVPMALFTGMPFLDAFFECVSGLTTTGLSLAPPSPTRLFFFTRSWLQWVGGIGIIVLVLGILIRPGTTAFRLYKVNFGESRIRPSVITTARTLGTVYFALTLFSLTLLLLSGMPFYEAICHTLSAISTGGFSTQTASIGAYGGFLIPFLITVSCIMGAISFSLYPEVLKDPGALIRDPQVRYMLGLSVLGTALFALTLSGEAGGLELLHMLPDAAFQVISALTGTGFSTIDLAPLSDASKGFLSAIMCIGGSIGSTTGGIKLFRLIVIVQLIRLVFYRFFLPREAITPLKVKSQVLDSDEVYRIMTYVLLYSVVLVLSAFIFMLYGINSADAIFETSSALATAGLSTGVTAPGMPSLLKLVLCSDMLLGRVEIIPLFILLLPRTWLEKKSKTEENRVKTEENRVQEDAT